MIGGVRYVIPVRIGQSYITSENDPDEQDTLMRVTRSRGLFSMHSAQGATPVMQSSRHLMDQTKMNDIEMRSSGGMEF